MNDDPFGYNKDPSNRKLREQFAALASLPGQDPIWLTVQDERKMIPLEGWFINATIAPGATCVIDVYHYSGGNLRFDNIINTNTRDGRIVAQLSLNGYENLTLAYRNYEFEPIPDLAASGVILPSTINTYELQSGRLLSEMQRESTRELICEEVVSLDISRVMEREELELYDPRSRPPLPVCRVTDDAQELRAILSSIGFASGMTDNDRVDFLTTASQKLGLA